MDKENFIKIENGFDDSEHIIIISENQINYTNLVHVHNNYIESINNTIILLKELFENNIKKLTDKSLNNTINFYFHEIFALIDLLKEEKNLFLSQYELNLRKDEQKIRALYSDIFNLKIKNTFLENNMENLIKKENEYKLIKEKTGLLIENGNIINNDRKDNEIFILRQENSNLKTVVNNNEMQLNNFKKKYENEKLILEQKIQKLNQEISIFKNKLKKIGSKSNSKIKSKSNNLITSNETNISDSKHKYNFDMFHSYKINNEIRKIKSVINKKNLKVKAIKDIKNISLNHCPSTDILDFKNKIKNKLNTLNKHYISKIPFLNFKNLNKTDINKTKSIYLTPRNPIINIKGTSFQTFNKISESKQNKRENYIKNSITLKIISNSQNKSNLIINEKTKNRSPKNNNIISNKTNNRIKKQLSMAQNLQINNPIISSSPIKINKIYVLNHNIKKINKDFNISSSPKIGEYKKRKRNITSNIFDNTYDVLNKLSLVSNVSKKEFNQPINNCKTKFV